MGMRFIIEKYFCNTNPEQWSGYPKILFIKQNLIQKTYRDTLNPRLVAYFDGKLLPDRNNVNPDLLPIVVAGVNVEKLLSNRKVPGSDIGVVMGKAITVEIREGVLIGWLGARSAMEQ